LQQFFLSTESHDCVIIETLNFSTQVLCIRHKKGVTTFPYSANYYEQTRWSFTSQALKSFHINWE